MVKGITKRVVVVRPQDKSLFEEAIFIVRGEAFGDGGFTQEDLVKEACRVADTHMKASSKRRKALHRIPPPLLIFFVAAFTGIIWLITTLG